MTARGEARALLAILSWVLLATPASAVTFEWVTVGDPGNAPDAAENCLGTGCGAVAHVFEIAKYEVTQAQYVEFLDTKAATDPHGLFNPLMESEEQGGITRSGSAGSYAYATKAGFANKPVNYVSLYDVFRFANWLHHGQGSGDTETGAYTITEQGIEESSIARNPGASFAVPSESEWYKAAYFDGSRYFDYPAGSDTVIACAAPTAAPNSANCSSAVGGATDVGSYPGSPSPYGTFDQGGNFFEWNETVVEGDYVPIHGGGWGSGDFALAASSIEGAAPATEFGIRIGFRLIRPVPEPAGAAGAAALCLLALAAGGRRPARRRSPRGERVERAGHAQGEAPAGRLDRQEQLGLRATLEAGRQAARDERALHGAQERAGIEGRRAQARGLERLLAAVGERGGPARQIDRAHEEARLLDLDLAAEVRHLHDVLALRGQEAHRALEERAQARVPDRKPLVGEAAVAVQDQAEGAQRRRAGRSRSVHPGSGSGSSEPSRRTRKAPRKS
ncbi:MAG: SUMF1/EgtB/PvdO family nonheme iron enzyme [Deltaproteobacteria bacterium]|nr:SUMF1/EgtB/PvdO family nonheme iron enzyme [Deltaproteobacteria bacterium]